MITQIAFRLYPSGYTGHSIQQLNELLKDGWKIKVTLPEPQSDEHGRTSTMHVLILEKES